MLCDREDSNVGNSFIAASVFLQSQDVVTEPPQFNDHCKVKVLVCVKASHNRLGFLVGADGLFNLFAVVLIVRPGRV